jgi:ABC-type uncharacterized transport system auxiliary subunit
MFDKRKKGVSGFGLVLNMMCVWQASTAQPHATKPQHSRTNQTTNTPTPQHPSACGPPRTKRWRFAVGTRGRVAIEAHTEDVCLLLVFQPEMERQINADNIVLQWIGRESGFCFQAKWCSFLF